MDTKIRPSLRISKALWEEFLSYLPMSISANEKLIALIADYVYEQRRVSV